MVRIVVRKHYSLNTFISLIPYALNKNKLQPYVEFDSSWISGIELRSFNAQYVES